MHADLQWLSFNMFLVPGMHALLKDSSVYLQC